MEPIVIKERSQKLPSWILQHRIVRFAGVGVMSTTGDILVLHSLYPRVLPNIYAATALGFLTGLTIGFLLNSRYVFKKERTPKRYAKYGLISLGGLALTELIVHALYIDFALTSALMAKFVAVGIVFFWNYFWSKHWAFKK